MTATTMYWITRLNAFETIGKFFIVFGFNIGLISLLWYLLNKYNEDFGKQEVPILKKLSQVFLVIGAIGLLIETFVPTTREMAAIVIIPKIVNSEKVQNLGNEVYDLAIDWLNDLKPESNK